MKNTNKPLNMKEKTSKILRILRKTYSGKKSWSEVESVLKAEGLSKRLKDFHDPFINLVVGILSQNTSDKNSTRAYIGLIKKFKKITATTLAKAKEEEIREAIRPGGLYRIKARRIKELSNVVLEKYDGDLAKLLELPKKELKRELMKLHGIGEKTADVFIAYCANYSSFPIDTNINRVIKRLGLVRENARYKEMQEAIVKLIPSGQRVRAHELFIRLGRDVCKSRKLLCYKCPIEKLCPYSNKNLG